MSDLVKHESCPPDYPSVAAGTALTPRPEELLVSPAGHEPRGVPGAGRSRGPARLGVAVIAASLVAAVAVGAAAFSGGSGASAASGRAAVTAPAEGGLASAASNAASATSAAFTLSATESSPSTTSTLVTGSGAFDLAKGLGQVTVSGRSLSSLTGAGSPGPLDIVSDGTDLYVNVPALSSLTGGKSWVETSASGLASLTGSVAGSLPLSALTDPAQDLGLLGSLGSTVTRVGTVELHGESTTEYRTTVSIADMASKEGDGSASSASSEALAKALQDLGIPSVPVTAWVGSDGVLRQLSVSVDLSHASLAGVVGIPAPGSVRSSAAGTNLDVTVGLSHYGQPVAISLPPASDVTNLNGIASSLKGMASKFGGTLSTIASHV